MPSDEKTARAGVSRWPSSDATLLPTLILRPYFGFSPSGGFLVFLGGFGWFAGFALGAFAGRAVSGCPGSLRAGSPCAAGVAGRGLSLFIASPFITSPLIALSFVALSPAALPLDSAGVERASLGDMAGA